MKKKGLTKVIYAILIGIAVVAFWRGAWGLMDVYLFPDNFMLSSWISIAAGIVILLFTDKTIKELI